MALLNSITGGGAGGGLSIAPTTSYYNSNGGLGGVRVLNLDVSTKALVLDATGRFALSFMEIDSSGTGGNLFISIEIDGVTICADLDTLSTAIATPIYGSSNNDLINPIIIDSNIKVWLQKTGATTALTNYNLLPLE